MFSVLDENCVTIITKVRRPTLSADKTAHEWHLTPRGWVEGTFSFYGNAPKTGIIEPPDDRVERSETSRALLEAMAELPPKQREVLHLVFYQDVTVREAGEVMGVSLGTARVHYDRGKKKLKALLSDEEVGGGSP